MNEIVVPVAVIVSVAVQTGFVLLWVGRAAARLDMLEARLEQHAGVIERLARLEEQAVGQRLSLERIEAKLNKDWRG